MSDYIYEAGSDPGYYPGTTVLMNRLDIRDADRLAAFEAEIVSARGEEPLPKGRFGKAHYYTVHRHLFGDVYDWAGRPRSIRTGKGGNWFCYPEHIEPQLDALFGQLRQNGFLKHLDRPEFAQGAAAFLAYLNAIHPFREGNGRTQLAFLALLAENAGYRLNYEDMDPQAMLNAMIVSFSGNEVPLAALLETIIEPL